MPKNIVQMNNKYNQRRKPAKTFFRRRKKKTQSFSGARFDIGHVTVYSSNL